MLGLLGLKKRLHSQVSWEIEQTGALIYITTLIIQFVEENGCSLLKLALDSSHVEEAFTRILEGKLRYFDI